MSKTYLIDGVEISETDLIKRIKNGEKQLFPELCSSYIPLIYRYISLFDFPETDKEDFVQIGLLAISSAVDAYDFTSSSFSTFVSLCIKRSLISKRRKISSEEQFTTLAFSEDEELEIVQDNNPESLFINNESAAALVEKIKAELSDFEYSALTAYLKFDSYCQAAEFLSVTEKEFSNALQRARKKIKKSIGVNR